MRKKPLYTTFPGYIENNKIYHWNHSIGRGGYVFILATKDRKPFITESVKNNIQKEIEKVCSKLNLVDVTIKMYPAYLAVFMVLQRTTAPIDVINTFLHSLEAFSIEWDNEYVFNTIEDVGIDFVNNFCGKLNKKQSDKDEN